MWKNNKKINKRLLAILLSATVTIGIVPVQAEFLGANIEAEVDYDNVEAGVVAEFQDEITDEWMEEEDGVDDVSDVEFTEDDAWAAAECFYERESEEFIGVEVFGDGTEEGIQIFDEVPNSGKCGDNLTWTVDEEGTLTISGTGAMYDLDFVNGTNEYYGWNPQKLVLESGITHIGNYAFYKCRDLTENLIIPDSVVSIGDFAFCNCDGLTGDLEIPNSVTSIGKLAFSGCDGFTGNLTIPNSVTSIGKSAFSSCDGFTGNLTIPDSVVSIGDFAFFNCDGFTGNLTIPNSVISIGDGAFSSCNGFDGNLRISNSVTSLGEGVFSECDGFTGNLEIPNSVTSIGNLAFENCTGFDGNLTISDSVTSIGDLAFGRCRGFTGDLTIPSSVTSIGGSAFSGCTGFDGSLIISNGVISIGDWAFHMCAGFTGDLTIPDSVTSIGNRAFEECTGFNGSLIISKGVTNIGYRAFYMCAGFIGNLTIPNSVIDIGDEAFSECTGFDGSLIISKGVASIGKLAFYRCTGFTGSLTIPSSVISIGNLAFIGCTGFTGNLEIQNGVTSIGEYAFSECSGFTGDLIIPGSVASIRDYAFFLCTGFNGKLEISDGVTSIGGYAFGNCYGFKGDLAIFKSVRNIGGGAFLGCVSLKTVYFYGDVPVIYGKAFGDPYRNVSIYYPHKNSTWTMESKQKFGDNIEWYLWNPETKHILYTLKDGWGFRNFARSKGIPEEIYSKIYNPQKAKELYSANENAGENGMCFGMVLSAIASSRYNCPPVSSFGGSPKQLSDIKDKETKESNQFNMNVEELVSAAYVYQFEESFEKEKTENNNDIGGLVSAILKFEEDGTSPVIIIIGNWSGFLPVLHQHALWGLYVLSDTNEETQVVVYDPNWEYKSDLSFDPSAPYESTNGNHRILRLFKNKKGEYTGWHFVLNEDKEWSGGGEIFLKSPISFVCNTPKEYIGILQSNRKADTNNALITILTDIIGTSLDNIINPKWTPVENLEETCIRSTQERKMYWCDDKELSLNDVPANVGITFTSNINDISIISDKSYSVELKPDTKNKIRAKTDVPGHFNVELCTYNESKDWFETIVLSGNNTDEYSVVETDNGFAIEGVSSLAIEKEITYKDAGSLSTRVESSVESVLVDSDKSYEVSENNGTLIVREDTQNNGIYDGVVTTSKCEHRWSIWKITKKATALKAGIQTRTCSKCGIKETRPLAKLVSKPKLNMTTIPLKVKQSTSALKVSGMASGDYVKSYKIDKTKIAVVSKKGKITAKRKGTAVLTVALASGKKVKATIKVQNGTVRTTKLKVNKTSVTLDKGKIFAIKATVTPLTSQQKATYSSSNSNVATVSKSGVIKAKKKGYCKITVKSGTKKLMIKVKVK